MGLVLEVLVASGGTLGQTLQGGWNETRERLKVGVSPDDGFPTPLIRLPEIAIDPNILKRTVEH